MILKRKAIALLITLFFIMIITISIGIGLKQVNTAANEVKNEVFLIQTTVIIDDVMKILQDSEFLADINSSDDLQLFFDMVSFPMALIGETNLKVGINISSARNKFSINSIVDKNASNKAAFESYLGSKMIQVEYLDMVEDVIVGIRPNQAYQTEIFYAKPYLFKDRDNYITCVENLNEINKYYKQTYNDTKIDIINFEKLFSFKKDRHYKLDVNCATQSSLEILGLSNEDTMAIEDENMQEVEEDNYCSSELCDNLSDIQKEDLLRYRATCTPQMYIDVVIEMMSDESSAIIKFEYDLLTKKGSDFVYEI